VSLFCILCRRFAKKLFFKTTLVYSTEQKTLMMKSYFTTVADSFLFLYASSKNSTRFLLLLVELFSRLSPKQSIFDPICIKSFMLIFDDRICPESWSIEFGYTLYNFINICVLDLSMRLFTSFIF
jgi:hypothetical protein